MEAGGFFSLAKSNLKSRVKLKGDQQVGQFGDAD